MTSEEANQLTLARRRDRAEFMAIVASCASRWPDNSTGMIVDEALSIWVVANRIWGES